MNNKRIKRIKIALQDIKSIHDELYNVRDDELNEYNNMPIDIKNGEKGKESQNAIVCLENAIDYLCDSISELEDILDY